MYGLQEGCVQLLDPLALRDIVKDLDVVERAVVFRREDGGEEIEMRAVFALVDDLVRLENLARPECLPHAVIDRPRGLAALEDARIFSPNFFERVAELPFPGLVHILSLDSCVGYQKRLVGAIGEDAEEADVAVRVLATPRCLPVLPPHRVQSRHGFAHCLLSLLHTREQTPRILGDPVLVAILDVEVQESVLMEFVDDRLRARARELGLPGDIGDVRLAEPKGGQVYLRLIRRIPQALDDLLDLHEDSMALNRWFENGGLRGGTGSWRHTLVAGAGSVTSR